MSIPRIVTKAYLTDHYKSCVLVWNNYEVYQNEYASILVCKSGSEYILLSMLMNNHPYMNNKPFWIEEVVTGYKNKLFKLSEKVEKLNAKISVLKRIECKTG